ncbi:hypothetical protein C4D60_Mb04t04510 [Musa balbisiana]|uniref:CTLH domain-containing protein n=1 Tax=Musa balbisiana TaxID=52838 RepID=A0A4V4H9I5_MUSBA|nr:hypothetical protein C4D60_Mb04t04510 [Musa balbisiana]
MSSLSRELVFLILQFLDEEKFKETVHKLEQDSGFYFNMKHFEDLVQAGEWDEVEKYLSGFTKVEDNRYSMKIFFEIRKQKYLEALDKHDRAKGVDILMKDLKAFASFNEELFKEITHLLTLENFRQNEQLSKYGDTKSARNIMFMELKKLIEANPLLHDKLTFPPFRASRLRTLINQSLNWQHQLCKNPRSNPDIKTLFTDHSCAAAPASGARVPPPTNGPLVGAIPKSGAFPPIGAHSPFQPIVSPPASAIAGWMTNANPSLPHAVVAQAPPGLVQPPSTAAFLKHPRTPTSAPGLDYQTADSEYLMKRMRMGQSDEVSFSGASHPPNIYSQDDIPKTVIRTLNQGVAFSKHIVQTYAFSLSGELKQQFEIDAHVGGVNDIAFSHPKKSLSIITCGDDKTIKVWDAITGQKQYTFEGHEAPVYSVCPHYKESIQFIFSTAIDGKINAWLYDCLGSRVDYDAPGHSCTTMAYSTDGTRLFSCGTSKDGDSHLVEWNETEGAIKRTYSGFRKHSLGVVQFDTTRNRLLAAGDEFMIKFWDMDNTNVLITTDADGGLPASPRLRFNREGSLLAVTTSDNGIKILANGDGQRLVRMLEMRALENSRGASQQINANLKPQIVSALGTVSNVSSPIAATLERADRILPAVSMSSLAAMDNNRTADIKPKISDDTDKIKNWKLVDIVDSANPRTLRLPDTLATSSKVVRLLYTNSGLGVLALGSNAIHKLWKWTRNERNPSGKSTASVAPQLWQPSNGILMANETSDSNPEEATACIALSKNDSYVMSASGGKVSLFNMMTFKVMTTFMPPPPAATFLAFHPQDNNIIAIGMEDSTIQIYNVRFDEVKIKLKGHQKKITGLAFSQPLNVLVSSGADAQLCMWSIDGWEMKKSRIIQTPATHAAPVVGDTKIQFHNDQTHLLVVHESQLAIYDNKLESLCSWLPRDALPAPISSAVYSCDGLLVYAGFCDGAIGVFESDSLRLRCRIARTAYISPSISSPGASYPMVIAAHPSEPNQIALGMSDGAVHVVEPSEADSKWGVALPQENGAFPPVSSNPPLNNSQASDPPPR